MPVPAALRRARRRVRRRVRRATRYVRYQHSREVRWGLFGLAWLVGIGIVWIGITALLARSQSQQITARLQQVRALVAEGRVDDARAIAHDIPAMSRRVHDLTTGPAWWAGAHIPVLGDPLEVTRGVTLVESQVGTTALPKLVSVAAALDPAALRTRGDTVHLAPLVKALPALHAAAADLDAAVASLSALPDSWLGIVDNGKNSFAADLSAVSGYVDAAARVARVLPTMLGSPRPQTYFIGLQNEAELRGTGGLPGAFAIAVASKGTIRFTRFESNAALEPLNPGHVIRTGLTFGRGYESAYGPSLPTTTFVDSNASPHFPYAARIWAAMWKKVSGQQVDAVLALDPTALAYFLAATGPATLSGGGTISAQNVITLTQRDEYFLFDDNIARKEFIVSVLRAAARKVTSGSAGGLPLVQAASRAASESRLLAWSADPRVEAVLEQSNYAGTIPDDPSPFAGLVLNNAAAGKLDFYLTRSLAYARTGCGATRDVVVTYTLTNNAPASGLPYYVAGRLDHPPASARPGDNHTIADYYATRGALLESVTVNGRAATAAVESDRGHPIFRLDLQLPRGTTQTVELHLREPAGSGTPQIWRQPGVAPIEIQSYDQNCT